MKGKKIFIYYNKGAFWMFDKYNDLMNMSDIQNALGIGRTTAYRLINDGKIQHLRIGKTIKIPKRYLVDFVEKSCYNDAVTTNLPLKIIKEDKIYDGEFI